MQLYELYMGKPLFRTDVDDETVPTLHTLAVGEYPSDLIERGRRRDAFFNPDSQYTYSVVITLLLTWLHAQTR